jgi:hypothetical protein
MNWSELSEEFSRLPRNHKLLIGAIAAAIFLLLVPYLSFSPAREVVKDEVAEEEPMSPGRKPPAAVPTEEVPLFEGEERWEPTPAPRKRVRPPPTTGDDAPALRDIEKLLGNDGQDQSDIHEDR